MTEPQCADCRSTRHSYEKPAIGGLFYVYSKLKLFARGQTGATAPATVTLYAYHFGNPIADVAQVTVPTRAVQTLTLTDPRLLSVGTLVVRYDALQVK